MNKKRIAVTEENSLKVQRNYKDSLFRMLFRDRNNLLSLYNAVNRTSYTDPDLLTIVTLENAAPGPVLCGTGISDALKGRNPVFVPADKNSGSAFYYLL